jgi:hypothetical protein
MGPSMQLRNEKLFTLFSRPGSNVVESAAILMEFVAAPHERWAELAKRMHDTGHGARWWVRTQTMHTAYRAGPQLRPERCLSALDLPVSFTWPLPSWPHTA